MEYLILIIIFTGLVTLLIKYLQYKKNIRFIKLLSTIILLNFVFYGFIEIITISNHLKIKKDFENNKNIQLYPKDHPDYGLLQNIDLLSDEDKLLYRRYFGDGGRLMFMAIFNPLTFIINIIIIIIIYFLIELIIKINNKVKYK